MCHLFYGPFVNSPHNTPLRKVLSLQLFYRLLKYTGLCGFQTCFFFFLQSILYFLEESLFVERLQRQRNQ